MIKYFFRVTIISMLSSDQNIYVTVKSTGRKGRCDMGCKKNEIKSCIIAEPQWAMSKFGKLIESNARILFVNKVVNPRNWELKEINNDLWKLKFGEGID